MILTGYIVRWGDIAQFDRGESLTIDRGTRVGVAGLVALQLGHGCPTRWDDAYWGSDITWPAGRTDMDMGLSDGWDRPLGLAWARRSADEVGTDDVGVWVRVPVRETMSPRLRSWLHEDIPTVLPLGARWGGNTM